MDQRLSGTEELGGTTYPRARTEIPTREGLLLFGFLH